MLKYFIMENGEQSVILIGISMMLKLYVVSLDIDMQSRRFEEAGFLMVLEGYGWTALDAQEMNKI